MLHRATSLVLILNFILLPFLSIAQAQIHDRNLIEQYRAFLVELTDQYPVLSHTLPVDPTVTDFETNGLDSQETRDFLRWARGFLDRSDGGLEVLLRKMNAWQLKEKEFTHAYSLAEAKTKPPEDMDMIVSHICLAWTLINLFPMIFANSYTCIPLSANPKCRDAEITTLSIWLGPIALGVLACLLKSVPQGIATSRIKRQLVRIEAERDHLFEELYRTTRLPFLREILTTLVEDQTALHQIVIEPSRVCGEDLVLSDFLVVSSDGPAS